MASENGKLLVLDKKLNVKNEYNETKCCNGLSATPKYIAVGSYGDETVMFYQRNGSAKPMVRTKLR